MPSIIDLRGRPSTSRAEVHQRLRDLPPRGSVELVLDENPSILLESLRVLLRGRLVAEVLNEGPPEWRVRVFRREEREALSLAELLGADHERLDRELALAIAAANRGDREELGERFAEFATGVRRHIHVEDEILVPALQARGAAMKEVIATMQREHQEILGQVGLIESTLREGGSCDEIAIYLGLLTGTLAKHEGREEERVFPAWDALRQIAGTTSSDILHEARTALSGG